MDPATLLYTKDHEWIGRDGDVFVIGITDHAQELLGDITYVELPDAGRALAAHEEAAVVESVKAASDVYAPAAGTVAESNEAIIAQPELVNQDPYGAGWFFKLSGVNEADLAGLMDAKAYQAFVSAQE